MNDPSVAYDRLRAETAEMLKLDVANLSLVEGLQLDLVSLLRLQVDELQGAALAGEQVDLDRLSTALAMLQKLLPARALEASAPAPESRFGPSARERLRALIEKTVLSDNYEIEMARDPVKARAEFEARLAAAIEKFGPKPASDNARNSDVPHPSLLPAAPAGGELPVLVEPVPPLPPQQTSSVLGRGYLAAGGEKPS
jgi:hypothetical protein